MALAVKDIMSSPAYTIDASKTAQDAGKMIRKVRRGFLVVTKNKKPVGTLSDSDLIRAVVSENKSAAKMKVMSIMSTPIVFVVPADSMVKAVRKMKLNNIHRLPVINNGKLVGVISLTDIAKTSPEMLDLLEYRLKMKEEPFVLREKSASGICDSCDNYSSDLQNRNDQWLCENCREESE